MPAAVTVPPPASVTDQTTAWLAMPETVATKGWVFPGSTAATSGATVTTMVGGGGAWSQAEARVTRAARLATRRVVRDIRRLYPDPTRRAAASWGSRAA